MPDDASNYKELLALQRELATLQERSQSQARQIEQLIATKVDRSEFDFIRRFLYGAIFTGTGGLVLAFYKLLGIGK